MTDKRGRPQSSENPYARIRREIYQLKSYDERLHKYFIEHEFARGYLAKLIPGENDNDG